MFLITGSQVTGILAIAIVIETNGYGRRSMQGAKGGRIAGGGAKIEAG
jgi:hypothetical protein